MHILYSLLTGLLFLLGYGIEPGMPRGNHAHPKSAGMMSRLHESTCSQLEIDSMSISLKRTVITAPRLSNAVVKARGRIVVPTARCFASSSSSRLESQSSKICSVPFRLSPQDAMERMHIIGLMASGRVLLPDQSVSFSTRPSSSFVQASCRISSMPACCGCSARACRPLHASSAWARR